MQFAFNLLRGQPWLPLIIDASGALESIAMQQSSSYAKYGNSAKLVHDIQVSMSH